MYEEVKCNCEETLLSSDEVKEQVKNLRNLREMSRSKNYVGIFPRHCQNCGKGWTLRIDVSDEGYNLKKKDP